MRRAAGRRSALVPAVLALLMLLAASLSAGAGGAAAAADMAGDGGDESAVELGTDARVQRMLERLDGAMREAKATKGSHGEGSAGHASPGDGEEQQEQPGGDSRSDGNGDSAGDDLEENELDAGMADGDGEQGVVVAHARTREDLDRRVDELLGKRTLKPFEKEFLRAAASNDVAVVAALLDKYGSALDHRELKNDDGDLAFFAAASNGSLLVVEHFLDHLGYQVDETDDDGATAFLLAAWHGHQHVVRALLARGANLEARCQHGWSAIMGAVRWKETAMVRLLIELGAEVNHTEREGEWTPMMVAAANGDFDTVKLLLEMEAGTDHRDSKERDALSLAEASGHQHVADFIREHRRQHHDADAIADNSDGADALPDSAANTQAESHDEL